MLINIGPMEDNVLDVIQRWEATGLLYGLPLWEKEELSQMYDNGARLILSRRSEKIPKDTFEMLNEIVYPVIRRLYRRVGINFDIESMMVDLIVGIEEKKEFIKQDTTKEVNPIVSFSIEFADNYEDSKTSEKQFSKEEYIERVDKIMGIVRTILLSEEMVSYVDKEESDWKINYSDKKKSISNTRMWNQKIAEELLKTVLMDTNKGI